MYLSLHSTCLSFLPCSTSFIMSDQSGRRRGRRLQEIRTRFIEKDNKGLVGLVAEDAAHDGTTQDIGRVLVLVSDRCVLVNGHSESIRMGWCVQSVLKCGKDFLWLDGNGFTITKMQDENLWDGYCRKAERVERESREACFMRVLSSIYRLWNHHSVWFVRKHRVCGHAVWSVLVSR